MSRLKHPGPQKKKAPMQMPYKLGDPYIPRIGDGADSPRLKQVALSQPVLVGK